MGCPGRKERSMTRQIAKTIIAAVKVIEGKGAAGSLQVRRALGIDAIAANRQLSRAVGLGLLTVDRDVWPHQYRAVNGWRHLLAVRATAKMSKPPRPAMLAKAESDVAKAMRTQPVSVWALAQMLACDTVALLPGWAKSRGASIEYRLACDLGMGIVDACEVVA